MLLDSFYLEKVKSWRHWLPPILRAPNAPQDECPFCDQSHQKDQPFAPKIGLGGEERQQQRHNPCRTDAWRCGASRTSLVLLLICIALVTQEQMHNVTPNIMINVVWPLNASKCQCHLTITMTMIATKIVTCQHTHKTTAPLQLNRLQQSTISWYGCSSSWSQTVVDQQNDRFIQQLSLYLAQMPKSDCLCNCAHKCIRLNVEDNQC